MSYGISIAGFVRKPYDVILQEMKDLATTEDYFGSGIDVSSHGEVGIFLQLASKAVDEVYQEIEDVYYSRYIDTAEGVQLDRAVALGGISRVPAQRATVLQTVYADDGTTVPAGFLFQTPQGIQFENVNAKSAYASGTDMLFRALIAGSEGIVEAGSIIEIVSPLSGIASGDNALPSRGGSAIETDAALRQRYKERSTSGGSSLPAIRDKVLSVSGVGTCKVFENATSSTVDSRPPHSIEVVVSGSATDEDIATAIFNSKPAGIELVGTHSYIVTDSNGDPHTIKWSVPTPKTINVIINLTINSDWDSGQIIPIKTKTVQVIGGVDTIGSNTTEYEGLGVGVDVVTWKIVANMDDIIGVDDFEVLIALDPATPTVGTKLSISDTEYAQTFTANITVNP